MKRKLFLIISATFLSISSIGQCPDSTKVTNFAQIMDIQFAKDFKGCNLLTEAIFLGTGNGGYRIPIKFKKGYVIFRCYPEGNIPANNPLTNQPVGNFVFIKKEIAATVFDLKSGQKISLGGEVYVNNNMGYEQSNFIANEIKIVK